MKQPEQALYITPREVCQLLSISRSTLSLYEQRPDWPTPFKPTARKVLYKRSDVLSWIEKQGGQK